MKSFLFFSLVGLFFLLNICSCKKTEPIRPQRKDIVESVYASGTIIATNEYNLFSLANGTIVKKLVNDGDSVHRGQALFEVKNDPQSARVETAVEALRKAESDLSENSSVLQSLRLTMQSARLKAKNDSLQYERSKNLFTSNAITHSQLETAELAYTASANDSKAAEERYHSTLNDLRLAKSNANSQLSAAQSELENFTIKSDANGVVFKTNKELGEVVRAGELVALIGEREHRTIKLAVDEQDIDKIAIGQQIVLKTDITGNTIYTAHVTRIYPVMNTLDQTFRVDGEFDTLSSMPFVHHSVEANIIITKKKSVLVIPRSMLIGEDSVMVRVDGKEKKVAVAIGIKTLDDVEIVSGLDEHSEILPPPTN
jgi:HlyD family secretion protein